MASDTTQHDGARAVPTTATEIAALARAIQSFQRLRGSRQVHAALMAAAGVDLSQQATQVLLAVRDGQSVAEVARAARMDMGAVSRQLKVLEDDGLLRRTTSPDNGAVVLVSLTGAGRATFERIAAVRDRHLTEALAAWAPADIDRLARLLQRMVDDLQVTPYPTTPAPAAPSPARRHA
jgi:DNA-binding MarR family transcriptional regulator